MTNDKHKLRAVVLAALMVFSVFAGTIAFAGTATAQVGAGDISGSVDVTNNEVSSASAVSVPISVTLNTSGETLDTGDETLEFNTNTSATIYAIDDVQVSGDATDEGVGSVDTTNIDITDNQTDSEVSINADLTADFSSLSNGNTVNIQVSNSSGFDTNFVNGAIGSVTVRTTASGQTRVGFQTADPAGGEVLDGARVFRGEEDITFGGNLDTALDGVADDAGVVSPPIPQDIQLGRYTNDGSRTSPGVTIDDPSVSTFEVQNDGENDVSGATLEATQTDASVLIEYNYDAAEDVELTVEDENGVDVTPEILDAGESATRSGDGRIEINPAAVDEGEYTFSVAGVDDLDFGAATQSTTITVTALQLPGEIDVSPSDLPGDGSESNPYEISNVSELQAMEDALTSNYVLVSDIDASQTPQFSNGSGFDPIGSADTAFTGSFDGDNHTITGLTINRSTENDVGVFGVVGNGAALADVTLTDVTVTGDGSVGTLAGENSGTIQNASTSGSVTGTDVVGGLVGRNQGGGIITDARSSVSTTGERNVGGLVGRNGDESRFGDQGIIANATASGSVNGEEDVGGLVGAAERAGTIRDTFAVGSVTGDTSVGGLVGENEGTVEDSYFDKQKTEQSSSAGTATGLATAQMQGQAAYFNLIGFDFLNSWTVSNEYPVLRSQPEELVVIDEDRNLTKIDISPSDLDGDGSSRNPYEISNASELQAMEDSLTSNYVLVSDIDATESAQFTDGRFDPIGSADTAFTGSFDGDNHTITGLTISRSSENDIGLFGVVGNGAALADVTLTDVTVTGDGAVGVGTLAGENSGTIQNASASGSVTGTDAVGGLVGRNQGGGIITDARSSVSTTGERNVGGLVGRNGDESRRSDQGIIANATASGSVNGEEDVGGLVGAAERAGTIRDTFAVGSVTGDTSVGGLVGFNEGTVEDSYFDKQKTEQSSSAGTATGLATAQMQGQAAYFNLIGFDFLNSWTVSNEYPVLRSQPEELVVIDEDRNLTKIDISPSDLDGDGSSRNPYEISNASELQAMEDSLTSNYVLVSDINATESAQFTDGRFDPIGSADTAFTGSFDGDNHTITGLTINRSTENDVGVFRVVGNGAALADVTLTDVTVTGDGSVGTLAGENSGTIQNASTSGSVTGTDVVGGLVGRNQGGGIITDARSSVSTTGERNVGGLVGRNGDESRRSDQGIIANATASGSVNGEEDVGGLVGAAERAGTIRDTFAVGSVTGDTSVGGLVGFNEGTVEDSYFDKQKTEQSSSAGTATGLATAQMQGQAATDNMGGLAFGISWQPQTNPTDYPTLIALQEADTIQQPIITLQSIDSNRTTITKGQTVKLTATVSNDGESDGTTQLAVIRNRDDQQLADSSFTIDGGATRTISVNVTPAQTETFSIQGPASTQSVTIDVADLNLVDVSLVTQEPVTTDETVIIDATVSNTGTTTGFIPLTLRQNEVVLNSTTPTEVPVGETVTQRLTGTLDEGTQNLTVTSSLTAQSATVGEVVVAPPGAITNATVRVGSESVDPGETTDVNLTLDQAPAGLAGYNLTVSVNVAQTSGVRVAGASAPSVFNDSVTETTVGPNNQTVEIRATDIKTVVDADETNISLGTVTVAVNESVNVSQATFTVSISRISDDTGTPINVTTQNGTVSVNVSNQAPLADGLDSPTDVDGDGVFEDVNGNERLDFNDIVVLFENLPDAEAPFQDVNGNGRIDFDDIVELFQEI